MGCVHNQLYRFISQKITEARNAAKASNAGPNWLLFRSFCTPGKGQYHLEAQIRRKCGRETARLG